MAFENDGKAEKTCFHGFPSIYLFPLDLLFTPKKSETRLSSASAFQLLQKMTFFWMGGGGERNNWSNLVVGPFKSEPLGIIFQMGPIVLLL